MTADSRGARGGWNKARWIAAGFLAAFATSILTVIYTGLMVDGYPSEFDSGFRSVTLAVGETRAVDLIFASSVDSAEATLEISLPDVVRMEHEMDTEVRRAVAVRHGRNAYPVEFVGTTPGSGYLTARLVAAEPVGVERVFVTVTSAEAQ
jgi:hypothetical protein